MDALPIQEANNVPYKSQNEGVMHACGHDVHTSSLLGTVRILNELRGEFEGTKRRELCGYEFTRFYFLKRKLRVRVKVTATSHGVGVVLLGERLDFFFHQLTFPIRV